MIPPTTSDPVPASRGPVDDGSVRAESRPAALPGTPDHPATAQTHEVSIVDGRFSHAECTCGWRTAGRRDRRALRREARDHALLYADPDQLGRATQG